MVENQEVWITDWADAKLVPMAAGRFDLDDYIDYLIDFLHVHRPRHARGRGVPAFGAGLRGDRGDGRREGRLPAGDADDDGRSGRHPREPDLGQRRRRRPPLSWFRNNVIATVPFNYPGGGRKVYPGFLQLAGFLSMNIESHMLSHYEMFKHLTLGDQDSADSTKRFYDEYLSVCDMTAEFYLQTIEHVFQKHSLPKGEFVHRGKPIDPDAIRDTALLAIEGERDDISGIGQTRAALDLVPHCRGEEEVLPRRGSRPLRHLQRQQVAQAHRPVVEDWISANARVDGAPPAGNPALAPRPGMAR
jgi:poly(3-hydroxybutyrate) depolymerase